MTFVIDAQVSKPCPFSDTCSSVGSSRCHGTLLSFPSTVPLITTHSRMRTFGTTINRRASVVNIISPILFFSCYSSSSTISIDSPELGPGAILGPSSHTSSSNTGAIVGGVVGGVAAISIAVALIFFYLRRRRSRTPSAAAPGVGASQPPMDEIQQPLTEEATITGSSLPTSSTHGTPGAPMRLYVRVFVPNPLCVLIV